MNEPEALADPSWNPRNRIALERSEDRLAPQAHGNENRFLPAGSGNQVKTLGASRCLAN